MKKIILLVLMIAALASCKTKHILTTTKLPPIRYVEWIENEANGLRIKQQDFPYSYELQYQPLEYLAVRQARKLEITVSEIKEEEQKRGDLLYFTFKMRNTQGRGILSDKELQIENKDSYLLSGLQKDLMLVTGQDTSNCVMLHFESANNLIPYDQCVVAFEALANDKEDIVFLFRTDKYRKGWVKMIIKREDIKKIPPLKTI